MLVLLQLALNGLESLVGPDGPGVEDVERLIGHPQVGSRCLQIIEPVQGRRRHGGGGGGGDVVVG